VKLPSKKQVVVLLLPEDAELLREIGRHEGMHMSTLVTLWIREKGEQIRRDKEVKKAKITVKKADK